MSCTIAGSAWRQRLLDDVRERLFTPVAAATGASRSRTGEAPRYGAEVELLALDADSGAPAPIHAIVPGSARGDAAAADDPRPTTRPASLPRATLPFLRAWGDSHGCRVEAGPHGAPLIRLPGGGRISHEPGGQIEYAGPPRSTVAAVADDLDRVLPPLIAAAEDAGIRLLGRGIDPLNPLETARLELGGARYLAMHRYLARIGPAGPRMMLQTAAIQVNVELTDEEGRDADLRWRVLHAAAPWLTAMFATSGDYAGEATGFASFRARQWRLLDRRRTGLLGRQPDPAAEYTDFALQAGWMFAPPDREPEPFVDWLVRGEVTLDDWRHHLTTLFPEVRPRGYLEVRCIDALPPRWASVPVSMIAGLLADPRSLREAAEVVGEPDSALLQDAARLGLSDPRLARGAVALFDIALRAGRRTGAVDGEALEVAHDYHDRFGLGRTPGSGGVGAAA